MADDPLDRLRAGLAEARAIYDGRDKTPDGETGQIAGVVNAVVAVHRYLREICVDEEDQDPLLMILAAFSDHDRGKPHPLFKVTKTRGRRGHSADNAWRGCVAAAVTLLQKAGDRKSDAIATVAEKSGASKTSVEGWHREISTERHGDEDTFRIYRYMIERAEIDFPDSPRDSANILLEMLPEIKL